MTAAERIRFDQMPLLSRIAPTPSGYLHLGGLRICRRARPRPSGYPGVGRMRLCQRASQCNFFLAAAAQATYNESIIANGWPAIELPLSLTKIIGM